MHKYFIKTPWVVRKFYGDYLWKVDTEERVVYLSFDDGPHPEITLWVLEELKKYGALASFFCIGKNVELYRKVYQKIIAEGHAVGNHTYNHLNGWTTPTEDYLEDVRKASEQINSPLFRPPYGRIKGTQAKKIPEIIDQAQAKIVMWDVLSGDFDQTLSPEQCRDNVINGADKGSIIVFHDSVKAEKNMKYSLPKALEWLTDKGFSFAKLAV